MRFKSASQRKAVMARLARTRTNTRSQAYADKPMLREGTRFVYQEDLEGAVKYAYWLERQRAKQTPGSAKYKAYDRQVKFMNRNIAGTRIMNRQKKRR